MTNVVVNNTKIKPTEESSVAPSFSNIIFGKGTEVYSGKFVEEFSIMDLVLREFHLFLKIVRNETITLDTELSAKLDVWSDEELSSIGIDDRSRTFTLHELSTIQGGISNGKVIYRILDEDLSALKEFVEHDIEFGNFNCLSLNSTFSDCFKDIDRAAFEIFFRQFCRTEIFPRTSIINKIFINFTNEGIDPADTSSRIEKGMQKSLRDRVRDGENTLIDLESQIEIENENLEDNKQALDELVKTFKDCNISEQIRQIENFDKIKSVVINPVTNCLWIRTNMINIYSQRLDREIPLGEILITIEQEAFTQGFSAEFVNIRNLTYGGRPHPHVDDSGQPCWGESDAILAEATSNMDIISLTNLLLIFLESCNLSDEWGRYIKDWEALYVENLEEKERLALAKIVNNPIEEFAFADEDEPEDEDEPDEVF